MRAAAIGLLVFVVVVGAATNPMLPKDDFAWAKSLAPPNVDPPVNAEVRQSNELAADHHSQLASQLIPRLVHQTFESASTAELPPFMLAEVEGWRALNPEYTFMYYNRTARDAFMADASHPFPGLHEAYKQAVTGAGQCDLWRVLTLWTLGGVYLDIDLGPRDGARLADLVEPRDQAISWAASNPSQNMMIYARGHPFLAALLERAVSQYQAGHRGAQETCGPLSHGLVAAKFYTVRARALSSYCAPTSRRAHPHPPPTQPQAAKACCALAHFLSCADSTAWVRRVARGAPAGGARKA